MKNCTAVILAGGLGTRLTSVVSDRPKVLAQVNGRPFLTYIFDQLLQAGCEKAVLCTGHLGKLIQEHFGVRHKDLELIYSQEPGPLGTGGAVRLALPFILTGSVLVMNGDSFCDTPLEDFFAKYDGYSMKGAMLLTEVPDTRRFGKVVLGAGDRVLSYLEKDPQAGAGWINAGIYLVRRTWIESIPSDRPVSLEKEMIPEWIRQGFHGHRVKARFLDIGTVESYNKAGLFFAQKQ